MPRLLANENFPRPSVMLLRQGGVDVIAVAEASPGARDEDVLSLARAEGCWLVTYDRDYGDLVFSRSLPAPPAIVLLRQEPYPPTRPASIVQELLSQPEKVEGHFVVVSRGSIRRRPLP